MANDLEANFQTVESPLLISVNPRKKWRVVVAAIRAFTVPRPNLLESTELELTSLPSNPRYRLRVACTALRVLAAFSRAGDANRPNEMQNALLSSSQFDIGISNLVRSRNSEQLSRLGGVEGVALVLKTDTENGIQGDLENIAFRRQMRGSNRIEMPPPEVMQIVLETIKDPIIIILLLCAVLSLRFGIVKHGWKGWPDGVGIFAAVFVVIAVTAACKIWPRRQIFKLATTGAFLTVEVMRNGQKHPISVFDVVVGDVICLKPGDKVPADGLCIHGDSLQVELSNITEAMESIQLKDSSESFLFSGSKVTSGSAKMLVTAVGMNTELQMLSKHLYDANHNTPLEKKLHKLAMIIATLGFVVAFLALVVLLIRYFTGNMHDDQGKPEFIAGKTIIHRVCFAVIGILVTPFAIASTAIPEGLLLTVIIPIAYSTNRIAAAKEALVRRLSAWEEIGSTTVICTNERGKLTSEELEVSQFWHGQETFSSIAPNVRKLLLQGVVSGNSEISPGSTTESIELAIRKWAVQPMIEDAEQMSENCTILYQKGDPDSMLAKCSKFYDELGNIKEITNEVRESLKQKIIKMKSKFPQCIVFSSSDVSEGNENENECITLIGVAGLTYPCPPEIKKAVNDCQGAGVNIILVTSSELHAARAIAFECGILDPKKDTTDGQVIEGFDFQTYPDEERMEKSDKIRVLARASTFAKRCLVKDLKQKGYVVAFIGDGIGDAAVLKEANVGLSLGQGTNIAKENSDIIIIDDSFESIATALRWGRGIYFKIQTYTQFQLTVIITSLVIDFITAISAKEPPNIKVVATISAGKPPFAALQVLWAKLIVGVLAALAITTGEPAKKLQQLPSVKKTEKFMTNIRWKHIVGQALYPIITLLTINFKGESVFKMDPKVKDTMIFNIFVLWQIFTILSTKRFEINIIRGIEREKLFSTIIGSMMFLQLVMIEALERFAGTKRLNWMQWAACIGVASLPCLINWLVNSINFPRCLSRAPAECYTYI